MRWRHDAGIQPDDVEWTEMICGASARPLATTGGQRSLDVGARANHQPYGVFVDVDVTGGFVAAMVASPLGVTILAMLETRARRGTREGTSPLETTPPLVAAAVDDVERMSFGDLMELAVHTAVFQAGPWVPDAPLTVATAYRDAAARRPIAEAISDRFGPLLHEPIDPAAQQWCWRRDCLTIAAA